MSTIDEICVRRSAGRLQAALLSRGRLVELRSDDPDPLPAGTVILGRAETPAGDLDAIFIDIGGGRAGFLRHADCIGGPEDRPRPGDPVLVQVMRAATDDKGPRLSMKLSLPGRFVVMRPQETGIVLSARIDDHGERGRLAAALADLVPGGGLTVRTAARGVETGVLRKESARLAHDWDRIRMAALTARPPTVLAQAEAMLEEAIRDFGHGLRAIRTDDAMLRHRIERIRADSGDAFDVEMLAGDPPLFDLHDIDAQIEQGLAREVALPCGGSIAIERTQALTAVDVDSGAARGALAVNLEAADAIADQVRLRNVGGVIVIDFITMRGTADRDRVIGRLVAAFASDPLPVQIVGWTRLGMVEMTRARRGQTLRETAGSGSSAAVPEG